jgi:hypothetical protein
MEAYGPGAAAGAVLSAIGMVERECEWMEGGRERLGLLKGAVMAAGTGVRMPGVGIMLDAGRWDRSYWDAFGR